VACVHHWGGVEGEPEGGCAEPNREIPAILLIVLMLLAGGLPLLTYVVWAYTPKEGTSHDPHHATKSRGGRTMTDAVAGTEQERVIRWMEEGPTVFKGVRRTLDECDQLKEAAGAAQKECQRLRQHCEELREEVRRLQAETERLQKDRAKLARWFTFKVEEAAARFPITPSPA
jgi:hypothetical protein